MTRLRRAKSSSSMASRRVLAVVGYSPERWDDYDAFRAMGMPHDVCCINRAGWEFPGDFKFWFSFHSTELKEFATKRQDVTAKLVTTGRPQDGVTRFVLAHSGGSSTLQAVRVALRMWGYDRVVLCGVSLLGKYGDDFLGAWREFY